MKRVISHIVLLSIISIIFAIVYGIDVYAVEDVESIPLNQENQTNIVQPYVNEPLDNAVPVIYKYEIYNDDEVTDSVIPGKEFTLKFTVYNPAVVSKIGNIRIIVTQPEGLIYPKYGRTNSVYIGYMTPLSYSEGKIKLIASKEIKTEQIGLVLQMNYTDNYSTLNTQQLTATLPVSSSGVLTLDSVDIPSNMYVGASNRLSISYQNNGLSNVNDVVLHMSGDSVDEQQVSLGNVVSGSSNNADVYLQLKNAGTQIISMYFSYADSEGGVHETEAQEYSITVNNFVQETATNNNSYNENRKKMNVYITIGVIIICLAVVGIYLVREIMEYKKNRALVKEKNNEIY